MIKIGEFSKLVQVPIATLRYYDQVGLLKPVDVDRFTGYALASGLEVVSSTIIDWGGVENIDALTLLEKP